jgi:tRNA 5-methylaminomethyl-2-thiouridine biosynthesis bifunctional protein
VQALSEALIEVYPEELAGGFHTLQLEGGKICLQLFIGDVSEVWEAWSLAQLPKASHWFLDGFAPSKNPEMWSEVLFAQMAAHAALGARFSTFTAAGFVRRGLQAAGFAVEKFKGFGRKREMLKGVLKGHA